MDWNQNDTRDLRELEDVSHLQDRAADELDCRAAEIKRLTKGWESAGETWDWILGDIWKALTAAGHPSDGKSGPKEKVVELAERLTQAEGAIAERDAEIERLREEISEYDDERSELQDERARLEQEVGCLSLAHGGLFTRISNLLERLETCDGGAKKDAEIERLNEQLAETCEAHRALAEKHVTIEEATLLECAAKAEAELERLKAELAEARNERVNLNADVLLLRKKLATALAKLSQQERET